MIKKLLSAVLSVSLLLLLTSCDILKRDGNEEGTEPRGVTYYEYFATVSSVQSFGGDSEENFAAVTEKVQTMLSEYNNLYDIYREYSGINNLKTVNDNAGVAPVEVDARIIDLLKFGLEAYELTNGEVNIMMGSVLRLWHDAREGDGEGNHVLPTDDQLVLADTHTKIDSLVIDEAAGTVYISDPEASIDVGAIAKGYATERIAEALIADTSLSTGGYALNIGGNIRLIGDKCGKNFKIGITNPDKSSDEPYVAMVAVSDTSVVTSGDYERYFSVDGVRYHHVIDKDTLKPSVYFHSVTVITEDSALADALTTALFSMHINDGHALVESMAGVEAMWVGTNDTLVKSSGFPEIDMAK